MGPALGTQPAAPFGPKVKNIMMMTTSDEKVIGNLKKLPPAGCSQRSEWGDNKHRSSHQPLVDIVRVVAHAVDRVDLGGQRGAAPSCSALIPIPPEPWHIKRGGNWHLAGRLHEDSVKVQDACKTCLRWALRRLCS